MNAYIEHANLYVSNLDKAVRFLRTALPEFVIRGRGTNGGTKWLHIGTDSSYLALNEAADEKPVKTAKLNHIGFVVDDVASIKARLLEGGYQEGLMADSHRYRKRLYFLDSDGLEWEFVQYLSDISAERNDYAH